MKIVGISACPTGIAHTYMAADSIAGAAKSLGHEVKIETQGAKVDNVLTEEDIASADAIIFAVDTAIDESRFVGRKVFDVSTTRAIKEGEAVVNEALVGKGMRTVMGDAAPSEGAKKATLYNHFMAGVNDASICHRRRHHHRSELCVWDQGIRPE